MVHRWNSSLNCFFDLNSFSFRTYSLKLREFAGHGAYIYALKWLGNGEFASAGEDRFAVKCILFFLKI